MERKRLIQARLQRHWTLEEAAERLSVNVNTLNRWEKGKTNPHAYNTQKLCDVYELSAQELGLEPPRIAESLEDVFTREDIVAIPMHIDLTMQLFAVVFEQHNYQEMQKQIRHVLEEHDTVNTDHSTYSLTRREALRRLATFPFVTSLSMNTLNTNLRRPPDEIITKCAASIAACWELSKSVEEQDLALAFHTVSASIPPLKSIIKNSSPHLEAAKNLLAQCYLFKMVLGWHLEGLDKAMEYAQQALLYGEETSDLPLKITIHTQLSWIYYYAKKSKQALDEIQHSTHLLRTSPVPLPPHLFSSVQSTLAIRLAMYGQHQQAITALRLAHEHFFQAPLDRTFVYVDYERPSLILEDGMTYAHLGLQKSALDSFTQLIDAETLASKLPVAGRVRVEALNNQTLAWLKSPKKDMEQIIKLWMTGIQEAIALQSTQRFNEAMTIYEIMQAVWPNERRIEELREVIVFW